MFRSLFSIKNPPVGKPLRDYSETDWPKLQEQDAKRVSGSQFFSELQKPAPESKETAKSPSNG